MNFRASPMVAAPAMSVAWDVNRSGESQLRPPKSGGNTLTSKDP